VSCSGISWLYANLHLAPGVTMPTFYHSVFAGRMPFLPPNQQCQTLKAPDRKVIADFKNT